MPIAPTLAADNTLWIILGVVAVVVLIPLIYLIAIFNRFVSLRQHIKESWADIDVELKRRYELIPNLVATVKGYAAHERETLEAIVNARAKAMTAHATKAQQAVDETALQMSLGKLFALSESYPDLKANQNFLALQKELANTEDRIAAARRFFNGNVRDYNQLRQTFPSSVVAGVFKFPDETFFELSSEAERVVPRVELGRA
jgi:LemA protein